MVVASEVAHSVVNWVRNASWSFLFDSGPLLLFVPSAGSADGTVLVWDMEIGDCVLLLSGHSGAITDLATAADGRLLVSASADGTARAWELEKGQCTAILKGAPL